MTNRTLHFCTHIHTYSHLNTHTQRLTMPPTAIQTPRRPATGKNRYYSLLSYCVCPLAATRVIFPRGTTAITVTKAAKKHKPEVVHWNRVRHGQSLNRNWTQEWELICSKVAVLNRWTLSSELWVHPKESFLLRVTLCLSDPLKTVANSWENWNNVKSGNFSSRKGIFIWESSLWCYLFVKGYSLGRKGETGNSCFWLWNPLMADDGMLTVDYTGVDESDTCYYCWDASMTHLEIKMM